MSSVNGTTPRQGVASTSAEQTPSQAIDLLLRRFLSRGTSERYVAGDSQSSGVSVSTVVHAPRERVVTRRRLPAYRSFTSAADRRVVAAQSAGDSAPGLLTSLPLAAPPTHGPQRALLARIREQLAAREALLSHVDGSASSAAQVAAARAGAAVVATYKSSLTAFPHEGGALVAPSARGATDGTDATVAASERTNGHHEESAANVGDSAVHGAARVVVGSYGPDIASPRSPSPASDSMDSDSDDSCDSGSTASTVIRVVVRTPDAGRGLGSVHSILKDAGGELNVRHGSPPQAKHVQWGTGSDELSSDLSDDAGAQSDASLGPLQAQPPMTSEQLGPPSSPASDGTRGSGSRATTQQPARVDRKALAQEAAAAARARTRAKARARARERQVVLQRATSHTASSKQRVKTRPSPLNVVPSSPGNAPASTSNSPRSTMWVPVKRRVAFGASTQVWKPVSPGQGSRAPSTDISPMAVSLPASPGSDGGHPKSPSAGSAAAVWISPSAAAADPARARLARTRMAAVRNVSGAPAPSGGTTRERLHSLFLQFSNYGISKSGGARRETMDSSQFLKLARDCGLLEPGVFTTTDATLIFAKTVLPRARLIEFDEFLDALALASTILYPHDDPYHGRLKLHERLASAAGPSSLATVPSVTSTVYERLAVKRTESWSRKLGLLVAETADSPGVSSPPASPARPAHVSVPILQSQSEPLRRVFEAFCFSCAPTAMSFEDNTGHLELGTFRNLLKAAGVVGSTFSQLDVDLLFTKARRPDESMTVRARVQDDQQVHGCRPFDVSAGAEARLLTHHHGRKPVDFDAFVHTIADVASRIYPDLPHADGVQRVAAAIIEGGRPQVRKVSRLVRLRQARARQQAAQPRSPKRVAAGPPSELGPGIGHGVGVLYKRYAVSRGARSGLESRHWVKLLRATRVVDPLVFPAKAALVVFDEVRNTESVLAHASEVLTFTQFKQGLWLIATRCLPRVAPAEAYAQLAQHLAPFKQPSFLGSDQPWCHPRGDAGAASIDSAPPAAADSEPSGCGTTGVSTKPEHAPRAASGSGEGEGGGVPQWKLSDAPNELHVNESQAATSIDVHPVAPADMQARGDRPPGLLFGPDPSENEIEAQLTAAQDALATLRRLQLQTGGHALDSGSSDHQSLELPVNAASMGDSELSVDRPPSAQRAELYDAVQRVFEAYCEVPQATDSDSEDFPQPTMSSVRLLKLCQDCGVVQPMGLRAAQAAPGSPRLTSSAVLRIHSRVGDGTDNDDGDAPYTIDFAQFQRALYLIASALLSPSAGVDSGSSPGPREYATDDDVVALYERVAGLSPAWKVATGRTRSVNE